MTRKEPTRQDFSTVVDQRTVSQAIAWLKEHYFDDINVDYIPDLPWMRGVLKLAIAAAKRGLVTTDEIFDFIDSAVHHEIVWQSCRNEGDMQSEQQDRRWMIAKMKKLLRRCKASKKQIDEVIQLIMEEETNGWLAKGSEEWLEVQRRNVPQGMSLDAYLERKEQEIAQRHKEHRH
jgi:hypothetical protein